MLCAILDLGSNSFHLLVALVGPDGVSKVLSDDKKLVRLGARSLATGVIDGPGRDAALRAADDLFAIAHQYRDCRLRVVGTSVFRDTQNGRSLAFEIAARHGVEMEILSGEEEARLNYLGARSATQPEGSCAVVDIGGGSVEVAVGQGETLELARSLPLGVLRMRGRLDADGILTHSGVTAIADEVRTEAAATATALRALAPSALVLTGGTARRILRLSERLPGGTSAPAILTRERVVSWALHMTGETPAILASAGIEAERLDTIGPGAVVIATLMMQFGFDRARVSRKGLREGLLLREAREAFFLDRDAGCERDRLLRGAVATVS